MAVLSHFGRAHALLGAFAAQGSTLALLEGDQPRISVTGAAPAEPLGAALRAFLGSEDGREHQPPFRAMAAVLRAPAQAAREILTVPVAHLGAYPVAYTARCSARGGQKWAWTTSKGSFEALLASSCSPFLVRELEAAALAVESGRAGPADMTQWLANKRGRDWRLTPQLARIAEMPDYRPDTRPKLCVGELLDALDCDLTAVEMHEPKESA